MWRICCCHERRAAIKKSPCAFRWAPHGLGSIRQLLTESLILSMTGAALGLLVAYWGKRLLPGASSQGPLDARVLLFTLGLASLAGVAFGIAPALRATASNVNTTLKENGRSIIGQRGGLGKSLLIVQVAVSLVLLIGAGLFLRTVDNLRRVDVGFNPNGLVLFRVNPRLNRYPLPRIASLYEQILERIQAMPDVRAVTLSSPSLLSGSENTTDIVTADQLDTQGPPREIYQVTVGPTFLSTFQIPLLAGRGFTANDTANSPMVAIINETAARKFFSTTNPVAGIIDSHFCGRWNRARCGPGRQPFNRFAAIRPGARRHHNDFGGSHSHGRHRSTGRISSSAPRVEDRSADSSPL